MAPINVIPVGGTGGASGAGGSDGGARRRTGSRDNVFREDELRREGNLGVVMGDIPMINLDLIQEQLNAAKELARKGQKHGEVGKHRSPQIKRSIGFMYDVLFVAEDLEEKINKLLKAAESNEVSMEDLLEIKSSALQVKSLTKMEMMKNRMASKSIAGWKTVSNFENDNIFSSEDEETAEKLTKRYKAAETKAIADYGRMKRGRGFKFAFKGRGGYGGAGHSRSNGRMEEREERRERHYPNDRLATMQCFKCNKVGHLIKDCPVK